MAGEAATSNSGRTFKSTTPESNVRFVRPAELNKSGMTGLIVEGIYQGSVKNNFDENKLDYKILSDDGTLVVINGAGNLGSRMANAEAGRAVRISYNGMAEIKKGPRAGKMSHNFTVELEA